MTSSVSSPIAFWTLPWSLRDGVQARADVLVLDAVLDPATVTVGVIAVLVTLLTRLRGPARADSRELLVRMSVPTTAG